MDVRCRNILLAMIISAITISFFILLSINPLISSVEHSLVAQMTWDTVAWVLMADFFVLTLVFYFLMYMHRAKRSKI